MCLKTEVQLRSEADAVWQMLSLERQAAKTLALKAEKLAEALRDIVKQDPIDMVLDPHWSARVARGALTECGFEV